MALPDETAHIAAAAAALDNPWAAMNDHLHGQGDDPVGFLTATRARLDALLCLPERPWELTCGDLNGDHAIVVHAQLTADLADALDEADRLTGETERLRAALEKAQAALSMIVDQNTIKSSSVINAYAACVSAEAAARKALVDQNSLKNLALPIPDGEGA